MFGKNLIHLKDEMIVHVPFSDRQADNILNSSVLVQEKPNSLSPQADRNS